MGHQEGVDRRKLVERARPHARGLVRPQGAAQIAFSFDSVGPVGTSGSSKRPVLKNSPSSGGSRMSGRFAAPLQAQRRPKARRPVGLWHRSPPTPGSPRRHEKHKRPVPPRGTRLRHDRQIAHRPIPSCRVMRAPRGTRACGPTPGRGSITQCPRAPRTVAPFRKAVKRRSGAWRGVCWTRAAADA